MVVEKSDVELLKKVFKDNGFNDDQIFRIMKKYYHFKRDIYVIKDTLPLYLQHIISLGYSLNDAIELAIYRPRLLYRKFSTVKELKPNYVEYLDSLKNKEVSKKDEKKDYMNVIRNLSFLRKYGFSEQKIAIWMNKRPVFVYQEFESLINTISYFITNLNFTKDDIINYFSKTPILFTLKESFLKENLQTFYKIGFDEIEVGNLIKKNALKINPILSNLDDVYNILKDYNISNASIKRLAKKNTIALLRDKKFFHDILDFLLSYGFNKREIDCIVRGCPSIFTIGFNTLKDKLDNLENYFSKEEIISITTGYPAVLSMSINNLNSKLDYLKKINLLYLIITNPKNLMQSKELTTLRYDYFKDKKICIGINLFYGEKHFCLQYGIDKKGLYENY